MERDSKDRSELLKGKNEKDEVTDTKEKKMIPGIDSKF